MPPTRTHVPARSAFDAFPPATLTFFRRLQRNNEKAWFHAHRDDYETHVRTPALAFADTLLDALDDLAPGFHMPGPQALCRPNRDLRWRPETPPYRPYLSLTFRSPDAARNAAVSFYVSVGPARVTIIGGLTHRPDAMARERVREAIAADPEAFATLLRDRSLRARFGGLWGGAYRRAHEGLRPGDPHFVLLARSTWCLRRERPAGDATRAGFTRRVLGDFQALAPVVRFLAEALQDLH